MSFKEWIGDLSYVQLSYSQKTLHISKYNFKKPVLQITYLPNTHFSQQKLVLALFRCGGLSKQWFRISSPGISLSLEIEIMTFHNIPGPQSNNFYNIIIFFIAH